MVWGGTVALSPADDILIRVERTLDLDSEAQLVASVLSKKIAAGSTHVLIDVPVGPTAKVRDGANAARLSALLQYTGAELGLDVRVVLTDGMQPVGRGIGPALEARDVLAVLKGESTAPEDLRNRAAYLAGQILEQAGKASADKGTAQALKILDSGQAWHKFKAICEAQGGLFDPPESAFQHGIVADREGIVKDIDNRRLANVAKLAGAPNAPAAGVELQVRLGDRVEPGAPTLTLHAEAPGELDYALGYLSKHANLIHIEDTTANQGEN